MTITIPIGDRLYEIAALSYHSDSESIDLEIDSEVRLSLPNGLVKATSYHAFLETYAEYDDTSVEAVALMVEDRFHSLYEDNRRNGLANYL